MIAIAPAHPVPGTDTHGVVIGPVAPGAAFYLGILVCIILVALWGGYVERRFKNCRCSDKPTLLRPRWKKVNPKDDYDRYGGD